MRKEKSRTVTPWRAVGLLLAILPDNTLSQVRKSSARNGLADSNEGHQVTARLLEENNYTGSEQSTTDNEETKMTKAPTSPTTSPEILTDESIRIAVHDWVTQTNKDSVSQQFGHISEWDTSRVTDMSFLFAHARFFNEDLSKWNVSQVTDMSYIFAYTSSFRGVAPFPDDATSASFATTNGTTGLLFDPDAYSLRKWDTSKVRDMKFAFHLATAFQGGGIAHWDVTSVTDLTYFAQGASNLNQNLGGWDTRNVRSFNRAFHNATKFHQQLCWTFNPHAIAIQTFCGTSESKFTCDPDGILQSPINSVYHTCCDCAYSANVHYYDGYHIDDDLYWATLDDENNDASNNQKSLGIILVSTIWAMVFLMICLIGYVTLKRRHEVRNWIHSKIYPPPVAPDGGAIATFVGPAMTTTESQSSTSPTHQAVVEPLPSTSISRPVDHGHDAPMMIVGAEHVVPFDEAAADIFPSIQSHQQPNNTLPVMATNVILTRNNESQINNNSSTDLPWQGGTPATLM